MIKNIVFDFGNVLVTWDEAQLAANYSDDINEQNIIKEVFFKSATWNQLDKGDITNDEAKKIFEENLPDNLKEKVEIIMNTWYKKLPINDEMCNLIRRLKQNNYKIYALSNTHISMYEYVKSIDVGKYFDGFLISAIERMMKPNEEIYYRLYERFKLLPEECFFIDDNEKNIIAGQKTGMKGYIFDKNNFEKLEQDLRKNNVQI